MMFETAFDLNEEGTDIRKVVNESLAEGVVTEDLTNGGEKAFKTSEVGDYLAAKIRI